MPDGVTVVKDVRAGARIEPGALGHSTALEAAGVRVVVLGFARGHVMKEHRTPFPLLVQTLDGAVRITAADRDVELRPGALLHLESGLVHAVEALEDSHLMLCLLGAAD